MDHLAGFLIAKEKLFAKENFIFEFVFAKTSGSTDLLPVGAPDFG
jgi:hypothetical protein